MTLGWKTGRLERFCLSVVGQTRSLAQGFLQVFVADWLSPLPLTVYKNLSNLFPKSPSFTSSFQTLKAPNFGISGSLLHTFSERSASTQAFLMDFWGLPAGLLLSIQAKKEFVHPKDVARMVFGFDVQFCKVLCPFWLSPNDEIGDVADSEDLPNFPAW